MLLEARGQPAADRLRRFQGEAAGEYGQPAKQRLLVRPEQREAPVQRRAKRAMVRQRSAAPPGEETQRVVEAAGDLRGGEHADACRSELDGQRDTVQAAADLLDGRRELGREDEGR